MTGVAGSQFEVTFALKSHDLRHCGGPVHLTSSSHPCGAQLGLWRWTLAQGHITGHGETKRNGRVCCVFAVGSESKVWVKRDDQGEVCCSLAHSGLNMPCTHI